MDLTAWRAGLEAIETDESLEIDTHLQARARALDFITQLDEYADWHRSAETAILVQRAEVFKCRLVSLNDELFQNFRLQIRAGHSPLQDWQPQNLRRQFDRYTYYTSTQKGIAHVGPDGLDVLVNGLFEIGAPPKATTTPLPDMIHYEPTPARAVLDLVDHAGLQPRDVFYDLGSGLGQVPILVNLLSGIKAKGVEFEPAFCEVARECASRLGLADVEFIHADAREADYADGTVFYMFTPFRGETLRTVLAKLRHEAHQRQLRLCTYGPCTLQVAQEPWVRSLDANAGHQFRLAVFESRLK